MNARLIALLAQVGLTVNTMIDGDRSCSNGSLGCIFYLAQISILN
jgi:hypothetical protein